MTTTTSEETLEYRALNTLKPNPDNPRDTFEPKALKELEDSIVNEGLLQPVRVRPDGTLVSGGRRLQAMLNAVKGKRIPSNYEVPCLVRDGADGDVDDQVAALIENLHREDLTPLEEANAYYKLLGIGVTQADLARRVARSSAHVSKRLALLRLDPKVQSALNAGDVTIETALALAAIEDPELQVRLSNEPVHYRDVEIARALQKQKMAKTLDRAAAEVTRLGFEAGTSMGAPPEGTDWEEIRSVLHSEFKGSVPRGTVFVFLVGNQYSGEVTLRFYKTVKATKDPAGTGSAGKAKGKSAAEKRADDKARKDRAQAAALAEVREQAKRDVLRAALKSPKKADVLGWALDETLNEDYVFDHTEAIVDLLDIQLPVDDDADEPSIDAQHEAVRGLLGSGKEIDRLRVALVVLAQTGRYVRVDGRSQVTWPVLEALGYDESKVKVDA